MKLKYFTLLLSLFFATSLMAQKAKSVEFSAAALPDELLEYLNSATTEKSAQKENTKMVQDFKTAYNNFDAKLQERVAGIYTYAVKVKMKPSPEMVQLTKMLTQIATKPSGGTDVANAYANAENLEGFITSLEAFKKKNSKAKHVVDYMEFCEKLFANRTLNHTNQAEWRFDSKTPFRLGVKDGVPLVWFDTPADLHYSSKKDEEVIHGTTGVYNYKECEWEGNGGRLLWTRTGLGADNCYAELGRYKADTKVPKFSADSVTFINTAYFANPIKGRAEDQLSIQLEAEKYSYPRFRSYQRDFELKDILPEVDYHGSFMMNGSKFITASSKYPATLIFNQGRPGRLVVNSMKFVFSPTKLTAENAAVVFRIGEDDSITNTGITVRYNLADKQVVLINDPKRNFYSPYVDSYHQMDIYSESISWKLESDELLFSQLGTTVGTTISRFESSSCYTVSRYNEIQGIDDNSPVTKVFNHYRTEGREFSVKSLSAAIKYDRSQTLLLLHNLSRFGLVSYNEITDRVTVTDKLIDYQNAHSRIKKHDYDAISLESLASGTNARLSLSDNNLNVRGVKRFVVSDTHAVIVFPDSLTGGQVNVGRNRSMHFSGRINVGKFILEVKDCNFDYEKYAFDMPQVKNLYFFVPDFKEPTKYEQMVRTPLSDLVGTLEVDKPNNHSGLTKNKEYPIFYSRENSFVYYDSPKVQKGQYVRDRFYYTLMPFTLRSLKDFVTDSLEFTGVLTSGGIFPDIDQPLRVQHDYYLGFRIETPAAGYPTYGGKGHYKNKITLDQTGLRGNGELDYLTSHSKSKDYLFLLDSMVAYTDTIDVREDQGFPDMHNGRTNMHWLPYEDSMAVATLEKGNPFVMYRGETSFRGRVDLMPGGAAAKGTANVLDATLTSDRFTLASREMGSDVSNFTLRSDRFDAVAFTARNVSAKVDYEKRHGDFVAKAGPIRTQLQLAKYDAVADNFGWEMDRKDLTLANSTRGTSEGLDALDIRQRLPKLHDMPGVRFSSTDPARSGMAYNALLSTYHYNLGEISSEGVFLVKVADAAIAPAADTLHVNKGGELHIFNNAQLVCSRDSAFHRLFNADLIVGNANDYTGKGFYDFENDQEKPQRLFFSNIAVENGVTVARGHISDSASFNLSSAFGFAGDVRLEGNQRWLHFDGGVRLIQSCISQSQLGLLAYAGYTDPENVHVVVPEKPTDWKGRPIHTSIMMSNNNLEPVHAFLIDGKTPGYDLLSAHGILTYRGANQEYMIASEEMIENYDDPESLLVEPYLKMSTIECAVEGEGPINFLIAPSQASIFAYGDARVGIKQRAENHLNTVFGINVPFSPEVLKALANDISQDLAPEPIGMTTNPQMRHALMYTMGSNEGSVASTYFSTEGLIDKMPKQMASTFLFDLVRWQYDPAFGYYYSGKAGLVQVGDQPMGIKVNLKARISMVRNSQTIEIYVEASKQTWYLFQLKIEQGKHELSVYSSNSTWTDLIKDIPQEKRVLTKEGLPEFRYRVGSRTSLNAQADFLQEFSRFYGGGDDEEEEE
jgi:hypothetical protein